MDPVTAIGLASSILSFIDFSWSLVSGAKELYESGRKRTKENADISNIIDDLDEYSLELTIGGEGASKHEKALRELAKNCNTLSKELVKILQKLQTTKDTMWQSLKVTWESMRKADDVASIESRLGKYRAQMNTRLLALLR
jgi:flagellar motility protein MotE (MotC chaperone)